MDLRSLHTFLAFFGFSKPVGCIIYMSSSKFPFRNAVLTERTRAVRLGWWQKRNNRGKKGHRVSRREKGLSTGIEGNSGKKAFCLDWVFCKGESKGRQWEGIHESEVREFGTRLRNEEGGGNLCCSVQKALIEARLSGGICALGSVAGRRGHGARGAANTEGNESRRCWGFVWCR
jgi:hypothetical protein